MSSGQLSVSLKLSSELNARGRRIRQVEPFGTDGSSGRSGSGLLVVLANEACVCSASGRQDVLPLNAPVDKIFVSPDRRHALVTTLPTSSGGSSSLGGLGLNNNANHSGNYLYWYVRAPDSRGDGLAKPVPVLAGNFQGAVITAVGWFAVPYATDTSPVHGAREQGVFSHVRPK